MDAETTKPPAVTSGPPDGDTELRRRLLEPLARLRRRCRLYLFLNGLERITVGVITACAVQFLLDRWLHLSADQRGVVNLFITLIWFGLTYRFILWPLMRPLTDTALAAMVDRVHPEMVGRLATAVQFASGQVGSAAVASRGLMRAVVQDACAAAQRVSFSRVLNHRRARQRLLELGGWLAIVILAYFVSPSLFGTWFQRNWLMREIPWPQHTYIAVAGFDAGGQRRFPRGDELQIEAQIDGETPDSVELRWWSRSGRSGREAMTLVGRSHLQVSLGVFSETIHFQIIGGDERTREFTLIGVDRPRVERTSIVVRPPAYTTLQPMQYSQQTTLEFPQGSEMEIEAEFNKPVVSAKLVGSAGEIATAEGDGGKTLRLRIAAPPSGIFSFVPLDADGWEDRRPLRFVFKAVADAPPKVRIIPTGVADGITPVAEIPIELQIEDDYGLGAVDLLLQRRDDAPIHFPVTPFAPGQRRVQTVVTVSVSQLSVQPGESLKIWAAARDAAPGQPQEASSEALTIPVVTVMELLARITSRELELRREFERLLSQQRTLRSGLEHVVEELAGAQAATALARLSGFVRQQDVHGVRCLAMRKQFEQILASMRVNRVARAGDEKRIGDRISAPLDDLGRNRIPGAAAAITAARTQPGPAAFEPLPRIQADLVQRMQGVLAAMSEWEGFREAVSLLEEIITDQGDVKKSTGATVEDQLDAILGGDNPSEDTPTPKSKP